jgi:protein-tyrosine phosphatase
MKKSVHVLFVCLGNICRSPTAEAVFKHIVGKHNLHDRFVIDSAGIAGHHEGEESDPRTIDHSARRGYQVTSISRPFLTESDFEKFDYIVAMDNSNFADLLNFDRQQRYLQKIYKMTQFCTVHAIKEVPDPYYGGPESFEHVIDILEDACQGLFEKIKTDQSF